MPHDRALSDEQLLERMASAIACVRTGAPPHGPFQQRRFLMQAQRRWRDLHAAGLLLRFH